MSDKVLLVLTITAIMLVSVLTAIGLKLANVIYTGWELIGTICSCILVATIGLYSFWVYRFSKRNIQQTLPAKADATHISSFRAMHNFDLFAGELFVTREKIWFVKRHKTVLSLPTASIKTVFYDASSLQIMTMDEQSYFLRYINLPAVKAGAVSLYAPRDMPRNDDRAMKILFQTLTSYDIPFQESSSLKKPLKYYVYSIGLFLVIAYFIVLIAIKVMI